MSSPPSSGVSGFPTGHSLVALGGFELFIGPSSEGAPTKVRFGWFEDTGSGSSVRWSTLDGPQQELAPGVVHDLDSASGQLLIVGAPGDDAKIVAAWDSEL